MFLIHVITFLNSNASAANGNFAFCLKSYFITPKLTYGASTIEFVYILFILYLCQI